MFFGRLGELGRNSAACRFGWVLGCISPRLEGPDIARHLLKVLKACICTRCSFTVRDSGMKRLGKGGVRAAGEIARNERTMERERRNMTRLEVEEGSEEEDDDDVEYVRHVDKLIMILKLHGRCGVPENANAKCNSCHDAVTMLSQDFAY